MRPIIEARYYLSRFFEGLADIIRPNDWFWDPVGKRWVRRDE